MNMDWQNSINPFYTNLDNDNNDSNKLINPLKIDTTNFFLNNPNNDDNENIGNINISKQTTFKPIPLPDDVLGFDPLITSIPITQRNNSNNSNLSFNLDNYFKADYNNDFNIDDINNIDNDFLDANLNLNLNLNMNMNMNASLDFNNNNNNTNNNINNNNIKIKTENDKDTDIEKILLDLGISEVPNELSNPNTNCNDPAHIHNQNCNSSTHTHRRKISGSGIFGFVGQGENTQLQIPGLEPVVFVDKKPLYKDITNFDNINFSNDNNNNNNNNNTSLVPPILPSTPSKIQQNPIDKADYYIPSGNPVSYKFPPSPPKGTFETRKSINSYSAQELQSLREHSKQKEIQQQQQQQNDLYPTTKTPLPTPLATSPLRSVAMSSPLKNIFQTPKLTSPKKMIPLSQLKAQSKFQIKLNKQLKDSDDSTMIIDDDKDQTISAINTPIKSKSTNFLPPTPSKSKNISNWDQSTLQRKNQMFTQRLLKSPKRSPTRKKPTITSTLATGTLDKYFIGPVKDGKYICKFFDKELQQPCNREFTRISNARAHIQTHLCDRPFVCNVCNKAFVRNHDLRRHQKGHSAASNVCPCGKKFPRSDALKRHRLRNICIGGISSNGISKPQEKETSVKNTIKDNENIQRKIIETINKQQPSQPELKLKEPQKELQSQNGQIDRIELQSESQSQQQSQSPSQPQSQPQPTQPTQPVIVRPVLQTSIFNPSTFKENDLFDFNEINNVDNNFSFNMDDSIVI